MGGGALRLYGIVWRVGLRSAAGQSASKNRVSDDPGIAPGACKAGDCKTAKMPRNGEEHDGQGERRKDVPHQTI